MKSLFRGCKVKFLMKYWTFTTPERWEFLTYQGGKKPPFNIVFFTIIDRNFNVFPDEGYRPPCCVLFVLILT